VAGVEVGWWHWGVDGGGDWSVCWVAVVSRGRWSGGKGVDMKERIKKHIRRWHPDRFETRVLPRVVERERAVVKEGADVVVRSLLNLLNASRRDVLS
jgi:hypothetical protein